MNSKVKKIFFCPVCKKNHDIILDPLMAQNRPKYPFEHVYLHKFASDKIEEAGIDVLTTLYIDADLNIRGAEALKLISSDIFSKEDTSEIINKLNNHIIELQTQLEEMTRKYNELFAKTKK
jgi:hypothetical protein